MHIDISKSIGAVVRELVRVERDGAPAWKLVATRVYATSQEDLWEALTSLERIPRWFLPITGDLRIGGHFQLQDNAGGEILICDEPCHLGVTWGMHGQVSWVDVHLQEHTNGTELRLEHVAHVPDEFWKQYGPGAVGVGWEQSLLGLDLHLATGAAVSIESSQTWPLSEEGKKFSKLSSEGWCAASISAGTDVAEARAAATRTTAFYTGTNPDATE